MIVLEWAVGIAGFSFMCLGVLTFIHLISNLFCGTQNTSHNNKSDVICPQCNGEGWYPSDGDCGPIQVQCEYCQATGKRPHIS